MERRTEIRTEIARQSLLRGCVGAQKRIYRQFPLARAFTVAPPKMKSHIDHPTPE